MGFRLICVLLASFFAEMRAENWDDGYTARNHNSDSRPYSYSYAVSSPQTGDHKSQWESRENGVVRGSYSLLQPDGTTRVVDYTADHTGFHPTVRVLGSAATGAVGNFQNPRPDYRYDSNYYNNYNGPGYDDYYHRLRLNGYQDNFYGRGRIPTGQQRQPSPALHAAYHGYDNLYH